MDAMDMDSEDYSDPRWGILFDSWLEHMPMLRDLEASEISPSILTQNMEGGHETGIGIPKESIPVTQESEPDQSPDAQDQDIECKLEPAEPVEIDNVQNEIPHSAPALAPVVKAMPMPNRRKRKANSSNPIDPTVADSSIVVPLVYLPKVDSINGLKDGIKHFDGTITRSRAEILSSKLKAETKFRRARQQKRRRLCKNCDN